MGSTVSSRLTWDCTGFTKTNKIRATVAAMSVVSKVYLMTFFPKILISVMLSIPDALDTIERNIIGRLTSFKKLMNISEVTEAAAKIFGESRYPANKPKIVAIAKYVFVLKSLLLFIYFPS